MHPQSTEQRERERERERGGGGGGGGEMLLFVKPKRGRRGGV